MSLYDGYGSYAGGSAYEHQKLGVASSYTPSSGGGGGMSGAGAGTFLQMWGGMFRAGAMLQGSKAERFGMIQSAEAHELAAQDIEVTSKYESGRRHLGIRGEEGKQKAIYGTLGVEMAGQALENVIAMAKELTIDRLMAERNARISAHYHRVEAKTLRRAEKAKKKAEPWAAIGMFL
jgi:hypothetical protein